MRSGMAMLTAIAFLVIIAGMMATMLSMTAVTTKRTEHMYFNEQAQLLARSATEFALLAISGHNRAGNTDCVTGTTSVFPAGAPYFNVRTTIRYIGLNIPAANQVVGNPCFDNTYILEPTPSPATPTYPPQSEGTVLIDVYVTSINPNLNIGETISYHRRTLQKP